MIVIYSEPQPERDLVEVECRHCGRTVAGPIVQDVIECMQRLEQHLCEIGGEVTIMVTCVECAPR